MSDLQNFLAPFSHLLFANRNLVIFFLCVVLFLAALDALVHRWKTQRLHRDLSAAKSGGGYAPAGRRYATGPVAEEAAREPGGPLPPVKGGRTYARNLGNALQKAGMSSPQIYSPPTPPAWATTTNPTQQGQPAVPSYTPPTTPWGAPAAPQQAPWAFQSGPGRPAQGPGAIPVPLYQPQPGAPPSQPPAMPQPQTPSLPGQGLYSPPPAPGTYSPPSPPFGQPAFPIPATGSSAPSPSFSPPGPSNAPMTPPFPTAPAQDQTPPDGARRGKPKRRRFNFNVLENLEKMVQPKPAEPLPSATWTPPPAAPAASVTPPSPTFQPVAQSPAAAVPPAIPTSEPATRSATPQAPTLPLQFGVAAQPEPAVDQPPMGSTAPATEDAPELVASESEAGTSMTEPQASPESEPAPEPKAEARRSMRSMMFGEEVAAPEAPAPAARETAPAPEAQPPTPADSETSAGVAGPSWPAYPWSRRDEASSSTDELTPPQAPAVEPAEEESRDAEPAAASAASTAFDPWTPTYATEPETMEPGSGESDSTMETATPDAEATAGYTPQPPNEPVGAEGGEPGAGTIVIIEDDPTAASYYATLFKGNGYKVEVANDGVSGVDLATRMQPQVILLDVMMPRQNGILVLQTLRASDETKNTPVVVMSNFSEPTLIKRALQLGALEYVIKTQVEGPALLNAVPRWMNREKAFAAA